MSELSQTIKRQLAVQLGAKEVEERLSDGKPHELAFLNAIFLDGLSLKSEGLDAYFTTCQVETKEEFYASIYKFMQGLESAYASLVVERLLPCRAIALAATVFMTEAPKGEITPAMQAAMNIMAFGTCAESKDELECAFGWPDNALDQFRRYLAETPWPEIDRSKFKDAPSGECDLGDKP